MITLRVLKGLIMSGLCFIIVSLSSLPTQARRSSDYPSATPAHRQSFNLSFPIQGNGHPDPMILQI